MIFGATIFTLTWGPLSALEVCLEPRIYPKTIVRLMTFFGYLTISWFLLPFVILHFPRRIQPNNWVTTVFGYLIISWFLLPFVILHFTSRIWHNSLSQPPTRRQLLGWWSSLVIWRFRDFFVLLWFLHFPRRIRHCNNRWR